MTNLERSNPPVQTPADRTQTEKIKAQIEAADYVLRDARWNGSSGWIRDYRWLQSERARLVGELRAAEQPGEQKQRGGE